MTTVLESDELGLRDGLPAEFRYLAADCPREAWPERPIHVTARHWLEIHDWFRGMQAGLTRLGDDWREGRLEALAYRAAAMPRLRQFLGNLEGHHHHESATYFPAMAALEPRMARGFDLLDRDHDAVHQRLVAMAEAANGLNRAAAAGEPDLSPHADGLTDTIIGAARLIGRHLLDEEEIIVPVLTLRGDPLRDGPARTVDADQGNDVAERRHR